MPAFNSRFKLKKIGHIPVYSFAGIMGIFVTVPLSLVLPGALKLLPLALFLFCLFVTIFYIRVGDELPFLAVKRASKREKNRVTSETWTDH